MFGVVGDDETGAGLADRLREAGATIEVGAAAAVVETGPDVVIGIGEAAVVDLVRAGVRAPVLPVGTGAGLPSVPVTDAASAVDALTAGDLETRAHRLLAVEADGTDVGPAAFDAMLVRSAPGRISEYGLAAGETTSRFRADGVVVATPAGSHGYAHAAGGPRLAPGADAVAVVPVAAFGLGAPTWVVDPADGIRLRVERDEGDVSVLVDGREHGQLSGRATVRVTPGGTLRTVVPPGD